MILKIPNDSTTRELNKYSYESADIIMKDMTGQDIRMD